MVFSRTGQVSTGHQHSGTEHSTPKIHVLNLIYLSLKRFYSCVCACVCMLVHVCACMHVNVYECTHACVYVCARVCACECMCACDFYCPLRPSEGVGSRGLALQVVVILPYMCWEPNCLSILYLTVLKTSVSCEPLFFSYQEPTI